MTKTYIKITKIRAGIKLIKKTIQTNTQKYNNNKTYKKLNK